MQVFDLERRTAEVHGAKHQPALQSLRGLAALLVVLHHCSFYYDYDAGLKRGAEIAFNAHGAVVLFFVLSGYVLAKSLLARPLDLSRIIEFYVRRLFRIYPALWLSIGAVALYVTVFANQPTPSYVTEWWWPAERRAGSVDLKHYALLLGGISTPWPLPLWTLKIEIIGSILMPFVAMAVLRAPRALAVLSMAALATLSLGPEVSGTLLYISGFLVGAATLWLMPRLDLLVQSRWQWIAIGAAGLAMLLFGRNLMTADFRTNYFARPPFLLEALGAAMVIALVSARPYLVPLLERRPLVWLGDISYSLYLLHMPVLGLVAGTFDELLGLPPIGGSLILQTVALTAVVLAITVPLSALGYRFVELPGIKIGKRLHVRAGTVLSNWRRRGELAR